MNALVFSLLSAKTIESNITQIKETFFNKITPSLKKLYGKNAFSELDEYGRIRLDEFELSDDVQSEVDDIWPKISTENIREITDIVGYKEEFLKLFGFGLQNVDYDLDVDL